MRLSLPTDLRLDLQERRFVKELVRTGDVHASGLAAGYRGAAQSEQIDDLLLRPNVAAAITLALSQLMRTVAAPEAYRVGLALMKDPKAGERVRADMVKTFLDRAGLPAAKAMGVERGGQKSLNEMSADELREFIRTAEGLAAERAKPVVTVPASASEPSNAVDMFD